MQGIDHYENFPVASWLCPRALRPPILAIYRFARTADDLADEGPITAAQRLSELQAFRTELIACADAAGVHTTDAPAAQQGLIGLSRWPDVFEPLAHAMRTHRLPLAPLLDLLEAFEQDVTYTERGQRYPDRTTLLAYCARSANPIGRLLLHLYGVNDAVALQQSDAICTALQLINFWQDRSQDMARGRDYLPLDSHMRSELDFANALMQQGQPLVHRLPGRVGWELRLVVQGGLRILHRLQALDDEAFAQPLQQPRPRLDKRDVCIMLWQAWRMRAETTP